MTKYEYAHLTGLGTDSTFIPTIKTLVGEGFEVYNTEMSIGGGGLYVGYFLRKEIVGPITHQSVPIKSILRLKALREQVWTGATNAPDHHVYTTALQNFFLEAEELLGLK